MPIDAESGAPKQGSVRDYEGLCTTRLLFRRKGVLWVDVGEIWVPDSLLNNYGRLNEEQPGQCRGVR